MCRSSRPVIHDQQRTKATGEDGFRAWTFRPPAERDVDQLMRWFADRRSVRVWGGGIGKELVRRLLDAGRRMFTCDEYSLFVFRGNTRALACYRSMGFRMARYPEDMPLADQCFYLTRPVDRSYASDSPTATT